MIQFIHRSNHYRRLAGLAMLGTFLCIGFGACHSIPDRSILESGLPDILEPAAPKSPQPVTPETDTRRFAHLDEAAQQEIAAGRIAGAVILVGNGGKVVYRKTFGLRTVKPQPEAMAANTIFDLASLTKVVATATAIMQLAERGNLNLSASAAAYWPEFGKNGKENITLRQLLTHTSGLRAEVISRPRWSDYQGALQSIVRDRPIQTPGTGFRYSDVNFIVLGEIVRRISGLPLDEYCARNIFQPLKLKDTAFKPSLQNRPRLAPSDLRWGEVQDPTAFNMGGVAGNAGLFSTADDLAVFAQMLIDGGIGRGQRILSSTSVAALSEPYSIPGTSTLRGLGWDIRSPYSHDHTAAFPNGSFGHTGYTGTSLWIDPKSRTFLVILTSRLHPDGKGNVKPLRAKVAAVVASALALGPSAEISAQASSNSKPVMSDSVRADGSDRVLTGVDALAEEYLLY